jgi:hypothetical protein
MAYKELDAEDGSNVQRLVIDIPRPYRDDDPPPDRDEVKT